MSILSLAAQGAKESERVSSLNAMAEKTIGEIKRIADTGIPRKFGPSRPLEESGILQEVEPLDIPDHHLEVLQEIDQDTRPRAAQ
jgi:hypothetical protein